MKERPILFNQFSAKANMAGIKTQTRRERGLKVINERPGNYLHPVLFRYSDTHPEFPGQIWAELAHLNEVRTTTIKCPYGNIGDVLWVRETWAMEVELFENVDREPIYRADDHVADGELVWKPSIHMPKDICRQWLRITNIALERLFDISKEDAIAEGIVWNEKINAFSCIYDDQTLYDRSPAQCYQLLLCHMHGPEWVAKNPWLWVITYEVLSTTGKPDGI